MKAAPPIDEIEVLPSFILKVKFEGLGYRYVDLKSFPLLGQIAQKLAKDESFLKSFKIVDGVPEWNGQSLLGPEDMLEHSVVDLMKVSASFRDKVDTKYKR